MKIKTSKLIGAQLDWAVAEAIGAYRGEYRFSENGQPDKAWIFPDGVPVNATTGKFQPSTDWSQGGPLIERFWKDLTGELFDWHGPDWTRDIRGRELVWFCRAIVAAKLGDEIEVPEELI